MYAKKKGNGNSEDTDEMKRPLTKKKAKKARSTKKNDKLSNSDKNLPEDLKKAGKDKEVENSSVSANAAAAAADEDENNKDDNILEEDFEGEDEEDDESDENQEDNEIEEKIGKDGKTIIMEIRGEDDLSGDGPRSIQRPFSGSSDSIYEVLGLNEVPPTIDLAIPAPSKPYVPYSLGFVNLPPEISHKLQQLANRLNHSPTLGFFFVKEKFRVDPDHEIQDVSELEKIGVIAKALLVDPYQHLYILAFYMRIRIKDLNSKGLTNISIEKVVDAPFDKNDHVFMANHKEIEESLKLLSGSASRHKLLKNLSFPYPKHKPANFSEYPEIYLQFISTTPEVLQEILNSTVITERQSLVLKILRKEVEALRIQEKIIKNLGEEDTASLKTKYLEEEIKKLESQLGLDKGSKEKQVAAYLKKLEGKTLTPGAREVYDSEISKLRALEPSSSEYNVTKNYLDWFTDLPWGVFKDPNVDIKKAEKILDEDHFGMKKIKERILEYIAVSSLKGTGKGKILCLVGPPGVGKV